MKNLEQILPESTPPNIKMMENQRGKNTTERSFRTITDASVHSPETASLGDRADELEKASRAIVGNPELEKLVIKGFLSRGNVLLYAELTNRITEACISLSDAEIDSVVEKFKRTLRSKAAEYALEFGLTGKQLENLQTGRWNDRDPGRELNPLGIKSVVHFVRARKKLHAISPQTFPAFYFENYLDAQHKIDLVEVLEGAEGMIVNLIQIKSHEYNPEDIKNITQSHRDWADEFTTDLESYEKNFSVEPNDSPKFREFFEKVDNITDVLVDVLTGEVEPNKNLLCEKLGIGNLPKIEQIWILENYLPIVREDLGAMISGGLIDAENAEKISAIISDLEKQLEKVRNHRKNLNGVSEIHSLCTVGERVVSDVVIFKAKREGERKAIRVEK